MKSKINSSSQNYKQNLSNQSSDLALIRSGLDLVTSPLLDLEGIVDLCKTLEKIISFGFALCDSITDSNRRGTVYYIIEVNKAVGRFANRETSNLIGKKLNEVLPEVAAACNFAAIVSDNLREAKRFRINRCNPLSEFEAVVFFPTNRHTAIMLVDSDVSVKGKLFYCKRSQDKFGKQTQCIDRQVMPQNVKLKKASKPLERKKQEMLIYENGLERLSQELVQTNTALSVLARNIDNKKDELEKKIAATVSSKILPLLVELQQENLPERTKVKLDVLSIYLQELIPDICKGQNVIRSLSPMEMKVAIMVKKEFSSEQISRLLYLSPHTIKTHRRSIRRKLNLRNKRINLSSYLKYQFDHPVD